ncbi:MAG: Ig domain-containing protein [Clostridia bacterium]|nr:Ig domain-containing protein [Clostridia bacterium]
MAEKYLYFEMTKTEHPNTEFRAKIETIPEYKNAKAYVRFEIQYKHSGADEKINNFCFSYTMNEKTWGPSVNYLWTAHDTSSEWVSISPFWGYEWIDYYPGSNSYYEANCDFEITIKSDQSSFITYLYKTVGTAHSSWALEKIDMSSPEVTNLKVSGNRYGFNIGATFNTAHRSYKINSIVFELTGLTYEQAESRIGKTTQADTSDLISSSSSYGIRLTKEKNLSISNETFFDLNSLNDLSPLDSGGTYYYSLEVTAENGKSKSVSGKFTLPQKVTGITCDTNNELLPDTQHQLNYNVLPSNAEELSVTFETSDPTVAVVDNYGNITAVSDGICQILVITVDGNFAASCTITVVNTEVFPTLHEIQILSATDISRIAFACNFIREELIEKGITVPELADTKAQGKGHPVKGIKSLFETIEANCQILRTASPVEITNLPQIQIINKQNEDWYFVVNNWIDFLNEIHTKINGGG